jgi:hypothetical protein
MSSRSIRPAITARSKFASMAERTSRRVRSLQPATARAEPPIAPEDSQLHWLSHGKNGAGRGNRTLVFSLEGCCSTIELHPRRRACSASASVRNACVSSQSGAAKSMRALLPHRASGDARLSTVLAGEEPAPDFDPGVDARSATGWGPRAVGARPHLDPSPAKRARGVRARARLRRGGGKCDNGGFSA